MCHDTVGHIILHWTHCFLAGVVLSLLRVKRFLLPSTFVTSPFSHILCHALTSFPTLRAPSCTLCILLIPSPHGGGRGGRPCYSACISGPRGRPARHTACAHAAAPQKPLLHCSQSMKLCQTHPDLFSRLWLKRFRFWIDQFNLMWSPANWSQERTT